MKLALFSTFSLAAAFAVAFSAQTAQAEPASASNAPMSGMKMAKHMAMPASSEDEDVSFGGPAKASKADRTITVVMKDMAYHPDHLTIKNGETVHFVVVNKDDVEHEFTLGTKKMEDADRKEMAKQMKAGKPMSMEGESNAITVPPHKTREMTWAFKGPEKIQYDCNIPGHFESGMVGTITITK